MFALLLAAILATGSGPRLDPQRLPRLPDRGLIRQLNTGVGLETLHGRPLGWLPGFRFPDRPTHGGLLQGQHGGEYAMDFFQYRVRRVYSMNLPAPRGCRFTDARAMVQLFVCRNDHWLETRSASRTRVVARAPEHGLWEWAEFAPRSGAILAQYSGECETPVAYLIAGGSQRPFVGSSLRNAPESFALGWLPGDRAVIHYDYGLCGAGLHRPGVYAVSLAGDRQFFVATGNPPPRLAMWGG